MERERVKRWGKETESEGGEQRGGEGTRAREREEEKIGKKRRGEQERKIIRRRKEESERK